MPELSNTPSFYDMLCSEEGDSSDVPKQPTVSPVEYGQEIQVENEPYAWRQGTAIEPEEGTCLYSNEGEMQHPGPPWFRWFAESGRPPFRVWYKDKIINCTYLRYKVEGGITYEMGTEGEGQQEFQREIRACPQTGSEDPTVNEGDIEFLTRDLPFNFAIEQALERLGDPGLLADVGRLRALCAGIPVFAEMVETIQELTKSVYKFHTTFNGQVARLVDGIAETKRRLEKAHVRSRVQKALQSLVQSGELRGGMYWPDMPEIPEGSDKIQLPVEFEEHLRQEDEKEFRRKGCATPEYRATQRVYNLCRLCQKRGHWMRECEEPHTSCRGPHCLLKKGHAGFDKQLCRFPRRQVGQRGLNKRKRDDSEEIEIPQKRRAGEDPELDMIIDGQAII